MSAKTKAVKQSLVDVDKVLADAETARGAVQAACSALRGQYAAAEEELAQLLADAARVESAAADEVAGMLAAHEERMREEKAEHRRSIAAKTARIREIESKFSFVVGTVTERTATT